ANTVTAKAMALQKLTSAALGGSVMQNPDGALADMKAGKYDAAGADDLAKFESVADAKIKAAQAQAREEQRQQQLVAQGDLQARLELTIPAMQANGFVPTDAKGQPIVTADEIAKTF